MKLKRWLSRGIVLAMVVALMVPMPVAAKSGKSGGKLVKSVTYYTVDATGTGWELNNPYGPDKVSYKYGKKNMPTEVTETYYTTYLGVPVAGSSNTYKIKYTKKSEKEYDTAGFLLTKSVLKGGKVVSWSSERKSSEKVKKEDGTVIDYANLSASVGHASYFKNGLMKAEDNTRSSLDSDNNSSVSTYNAVYAWVQKKGIPSMMTQTRVYDGGEGEKYYAIYNAKGLVVEEGYVDDEGKNHPWTAYTYTMKKGKVATAVVYDIDPETKQPTPERMMKFKYTKKSVSKKFNARMMNSIMGADGFIWY